MKKTILLLLTLCMVLPLAVACGNTTDDGYNAAGGADGSGNTNNGGWRP